MVSVPARQTCMYRWALVRLQVLKQGSKLPTGGLGLPLVQPVQRLLVQMSWVLLRLSGLAPKKTTYNT